MKINPLEEETIEDSPQLTENTEDEIQLNSMFMAFDQGISVHTQKTEFNKDFTLSDLSINERYFVREQMKLAKVVMKFVEDKKAENRLKSLLMMDVHNTIILSRAKNGRMIKLLGAWLVKSGTGSQLVEESQPESSGFFGGIKRMFTRSKPPGA